MKYCNLQGSLGGLPVGQLPELFELPYCTDGVVHRQAGPLELDPCGPCSLEALNRKADDVVADLKPTVPVLPADLQHGRVPEHGVLC